MKILLIEDDKMVTNFIVKGLEEFGHIVDTAHDGEAGLYLAKQQRYDVLVIDRMLPKLDGLSVIQNLRGEGYTTPILILSALGETDDRVKGLRSGSDDYLVKPFAFAELMARIEVLERRGHQTSGSNNPTILKNGPLVMNLITRKVTLNQEVIELQSREFKILEFFLRNQEQLITRTMLLEQVWDYHFDPQTNVIDVHISRLRQKLDGQRKQSFIKTIRGSGYMMHAQQN